MFEKDEKEGKGWTKKWEKRFENRPQANLKIGNSFLGLENQSFTLEKSSFNVENPVFAFKKFSFSL